MALNLTMLISIVIFIAAYCLIIWDKLDRAVVSMSAAILMVLTRILSQEDAFGVIDYNTIGLLISMMIIVMISKRSGIFEYLAVKTVKVAKGEPTKILILLSIITGLLSAVLDNVTTILLILPITLSVAKDLRIDSKPFIISAIFASNVGGTATLIGDPPNIMIGSAAGLSFMDFLRGVAPIAILILIITIYILAFIYKKRLVTTSDAKMKVIQVNENECIKDPILLKKTLIVLGITVLGFILHGMLHFESATIAITGAVVLLLISNIPSEKILYEVEWKTIFFFVGLFIMVGALEETGVINLLAKWVISITHGDIILTVMGILWVSAIASAFIDNIPFVATMIPLIQNMGSMTGMNLEPIWWALSLGACLGGNGTVIGASANVIGLGMAEKQGIKITFVEYFKLAFPLMMFTIVLSSIYLISIYLI